MSDKGKAGAVGAGEWTREEHLTVENGGGHDGRSGHKNGGLGKVSGMLA